MKQFADRDTVATKILQLIEQNDIVYKETFWYNLRKDGGWRLSDIGHAMCEQAKITSTSVKLWDDGHKYRTAVDSKTLLKLSKFIQSPYYIQFGKIKKNIIKTTDIYLKLYDERIATMMILYGSVQAYLESIENV